MDTASTASHTVQLHGCAKLEGQHNWHRCCGSISIRPAAVAQDLWKSRQPPTPLRLDELLPPAAAAVQVWRCPFASYFTALGSYQSIADRQMLPAGLRGVTFVYRNISRSLEVPKPLGAPTPCSTLIASYGYAGAACEWRRRNCGGGVCIGSARPDRRAPPAQRPGGLLSLLKAALQGSALLGASQHGAAARSAQRALTRPRNATSNMIEYTRTKGQAGWWGPA